ncbi:MAG: DUF4174 domain-containing protein [Saprospiraceae bacterium]|nr:DUF4174 domain-containing protein [Saprospiraceae bacterium]
MNKTQFIFTMYLILIGYLGIMKVQGQDLSKHQWKNRILIVKTNSKSAEIYQTQIRLFEAATEGLADRKLVLYQMANQEFEFIDYAHPHSTQKGSWSTQDHQKLLNQSEDFEVLLLGLDGRVKLRKTEVLNIQELYGIIDVMPMRRQELREKSKNK